MFSPVIIGGGLAFERHEMENLKRLSAIILSAFGVAACGGGSGGGGFPTGPVACEFSQVVVTMTMSELPETITYNRESTPIGRVEYDWAVSFDLSGDGAINADDALLRVLTFKQSGPEQSGSIESLGADLWVYSSDSTTSRVGPVALERSGNTLIISADVDDYPEHLQFVCPETLVYFQTDVFDDETGEPIKDYFPASNTYTNVPASREMMDASGDVSAAEIDLVHMEVLLQ